VEQAVLTIPRARGNGSLVPRSLREDFAAGKDHSRADSRAQPRARAADLHRGGPSRGHRVQDVVAGGQSAAFMQAHERRLRWTFDWPVNRITQTTADGEKVIDID
jgi:hypothetical protein